MHMTSCSKGAAISVTACHVDWMQAAPFLQKVAQQQRDEKKEELSAEQFTLRKDQERRALGAEVITIDRDYAERTGGSGYRPKVATW